MSHRSVILSVLLLTILTVVQSNAVECNAEEESDSKSLVRERRQLTVPQLANALGVFLEQLLTSVANLLAVLGASLPIILGALALVGLGVALETIVTQLGVVVQTLSEKEPQAIPTPSTDRDCASAVAKLNAAKTAATNIGKLTSVAQTLNVTAQLTAVQNALNTILNLVKLPNPSLITIESNLSELSTNLNNAGSKIQSTTAAHWYRQFL